jgi:DNA-binding response OmpR family regulator
MNTMKVLCVEHSQPCMQTLCWMLEGAGYEVLPASNAEEAMSLFNAQSVQGVLVEYDLPDKNGMSVREELQRINPDVPVLLFSGLGPQTPMLLRFFNACVRERVGC